VQHQAVQQIFKLVSFYTATGLKKLLFGSAVATVTLRSGDASVDSVGPLCCQISHVISVAKDWKFYEDLPISTKNY